MQTLATQVFNGAAGRDAAAYTFDYAREVALAWDMFPEAREKVIFLNASDNAALVYPGEEGREEAQQLANRYNVAAEQARAFKSFGMKNSFCLPISGGRRFLFLLLDKHPHNLLAAAAPLAQETVFVFDHELGHAVIKGGTYGDNTRNRAECTADAYAVIRHFQRFGADSPYIEGLVANRAFDLTFRRAGYGDSHFTSAVVESIIQCRYLIDWNKLSPHETTELARAFVQQNAMKPENLKKLDRSLTALHGGAGEVEQGGMKPALALVREVLASGSPDVATYGAHALEACADVIGGTDGGYLRKIRQKLPAVRP